MPQTFFEDSDMSIARPCGQARITFPFEGDSFATTHKIAMLVPASNPTKFKYQLFAPQPDQTNSCREAFILEQDFQMGKDFFTPLPIGTPYDVADYWPNYQGRSPSIDIASAVLISEGGFTDLSATQVRWTRTYAVVPPARNTWESFVFTFPGAAPDKIGTQTNDDLAAIAGLGNLTSGGGPITVEVQARVEHIYFLVTNFLDGSGSYSPNISDYTAADYIVPTFRVFYGNFYNEQQYLFDANWQDIIDWATTTLSGGSVDPPAFNTIPPLSNFSPNADDNDTDSGAPYIGTGGILGAAEVCVKQSTIRPWRGNIYEKITLWALAQ